MDQLDEDGLELFSVLAWCLWSNRNHRVHEGSSREPVDVVAFGVGFLQEFKAAIANESPITTS